MKFISFIFLLLIITNNAKADIYWLYEFYNISSNFNIFSLNDDEYQQCLKKQLSENDYKKAVEFKSSITQKMEDAADQCVEKLLISQSNTNLQQCLKNELNDQSYNSFITKHFSKNPKKNDFKVFHKCLSELKTNTVVASSKQYNEFNSCPEGYILVNDTCQIGKSKNPCPEGYLLKNDTCQFDKSKKKNSKQQNEKILSDEEAYGSNKFYANMWLKTMDEISSLLLESQINNKQKYLNIVNNAISVFRRMENATPDQQRSTGKQMVEVINLLEKNFKAHKNVEKYKDVLMKIAGIMTSGRPPADIFIANKVYDCKSHSKPFFTHHVTDLSKIKKILAWGSVRTGGGATDSLKSHTYMVIKKVGSEVLVHVPTDSYLIGYEASRLYEFRDTIHHTLHFQASCEIAYRFGHLDIIEPSLQEKIGTLVTQEIQHKSKIMPIRPPIFVKGGTLVAITKGVPISGWWDFGLSNKNNNNQLPKRLSAYKGNIEEESFSFADCPYDYFIEDLKKAYYKKIKKKRCGPKEIVFSGTQKSNDQDNISITEHQKDLEISKSPDPALNNCYKKVLGERRYQEVIFLGSQKPKDQENISIIECQKNPDYWSAESFALGYNTPDYYYDIFDGSKIEDCVSNPNPVFTHEITDFSQIRKLQRWGLTPQGYLKNHTYIFLKNKGHSGNRVIIDKPVPVYAPVDSHLIMQTRYRLQGLKEVQWRLMFQVGCKIVYRFDHLDTPSDRILKHLGNIPIDESQVSAPNVAVQPPLKITAGELIAHTKGTPQGGTWDFGVVDMSKNNELPKRLIKYENKPAGRQYKYAACPYDYYPDDIKKKYLKKMKRKKCNPKEIKKIK